MPVEALHCTGLTGLTELGLSEKNMLHSTGWDSPVLQLAFVMSLLLMVTVHVSAVGKEKWEYIMHVE